MKNFKKIMSLLLALTLCLSFPVGASAAVYDGDDPREGVLIDEEAEGSLTIYKYDLTNGATRS